MDVKLKDGSVSVGASSLADRLKAVRERAGLSQDAMSKAVGVSVAAYRNYEWGNRDMPLHIGRSIIAHFDLDAEWFLFGDHERSEFSKKGAE